MFNATVGASVDVAIIFPTERVTWVKVFGGSVFCIFEAYLPKPQHVLPSAAIVKWPFCRCLEMKDDAVLSNSVAFTFHPKTESNGTQKEKMSSSVVATRHSYLTEQPDQAFAIHPLSPVLIPYLFTVSKRLSSPSRSSIFLPWKHKFRFRSRLLQLPSQLLFCRHLLGFRLNFF